MIGCLLALHGAIYTYSNSVGLAHLILNEKQQTIASVTIIREILDEFESNYINPCYCSDSAVLCQFCIVYSQL